MGPLQRVAKMLETGVSQGGSAVATPPLCKPVDQMRVAELRRALEARGLEPSGLKVALVARLQAALAEVIVVAAAFTTRKL